jgi:serine/threonine protein kinase
MLISTALLLEIVISVIMYVLRQNCRAAGWWRIIKIIIILAIKKTTSTSRTSSTGYSDLKSNNIFLHEDLSVKIGNFGLATTKTI